MSSDTKFLITLNLLASMVLVYRVEPCAASIMAILLLVLVYTLVKSSGRS